MDKQQLSLSLHKVLNLKRLYLSGLWESRRGLTQFSSAAQPGLSSIRSGGFCKGCICAPPAGCAGRPLQLGGRERCLCVRVGGWT